jgi:hypothetical protein
MYKKQVDDARIQADRARENHKLAEMNLVQADAVLKRDEIELENSKQKYEEADKKLTRLFDELFATEEEIESIHGTFNKNKKELFFVEMRLMEIMQEEKSLEEKVYQEREERDAKYKSVKKAEEILRTTEDMEDQYSDVVNKLGNLIHELKSLREELSEEEFVCAESLAYYISNTVKEFTSKYLVGTDISEQENEAFALLDVFISADEHAEEWAQSYITRPSNHTVQWLAVVLMRFYVAQRRFYIASSQFEYNQSQIDNSRDVLPNYSLPSYIEIRDCLSEENALFEREEKRYIDEINVIEVAVDAVSEQQDMNMVET